MVQLVVFFNLLLDTLAACSHDGNLAVFWWSDGVCVWYVRPKAQFFDEASEDFQVFKLRAPWNSKVFVYSSRKLRFNKSWDHTAQRGPWERLCSAVDCIYLFLGVICIYIHIFMLVLSSHYIRKFFKDLPCFLVLLLELPIESNRVFLK